MSLVRLLAAGKSLVGVQDTTSRYHLSKQAALPKFISPKNPFAPVAKPAAVRTAEVRAAPAASAAELAAASLKETRKLPVAVVRRAAEPSQSATPQKPGRPVRALFQKLNPLPLLASIKPAPKPARAAPAKAPVQGELSLDRVKVVRNDLSDADLEVVPVKSSAAKPSGNRLLPAVTTSRPAETPWEQLTARIFGAGQT